ncbi:VG15 protein [Micrococcus luteus]|uniref:VG15 protein n=1 Tax=Micrococcus luteus TaxID=1270 RepID=UPI00366F5B72
MSVVDLTQSRRVEQRLVNQALRDLRRLYNAMDLTDGVRARDALIEILKDLTLVYGEAVATVAMETFMRMREKAGIKGTYTPVLAPPPPDAQIDSSVRWAVDTLFGDKFDKKATLTKLEGITARLVLQQGRETTAKNVTRKGSGAYAFARILGPGEDNCEFCVMLSSRGAVYRSFDSASAAFHDNCRCSVVPAFEGQEVAGYDPEALYQKYKNSR